MKTHGLALLCNVALDGKILITTGDSYYRSLGSQNHLLELSMVVPPKVLIDFQQTPVEGVC